MVEITEAEETQPLMSQKQQSSPITKRVTTKVPEIMIHLYKSGKGPIDIFTSSLGGWERDQLEVGDILDKYGLKSLYALIKLKRLERAADVVFITIDLPNAKDVKFKLEPEGKFYFSATAGADNVPYEIDVNLYDKVDVNVREEVERWLEKYCLPYKERRKQMVEQAFEARWKDSGFCETDMDFSDIDFSNLNMGGGDGFDAEGDEHDMTVSHSRRGDGRGSYR
ncbi:co-chaperone protein p23-1-like protein isoform X2 [Tanacetum coccineum]